MGLRDFFNVSEVFILVTLLSLDRGIRTYADHTASETVKNQCSIVCPRARSCQPTRLSGRFYLQCSRIGGTYKLHPYVETRPTSRHADRKPGRIHNAYQNVIAQNQNLIGNSQLQNRTNAFRETTQPRAGQKLGPIVPIDVLIVKPRPDTLAHEYLPDNMPKPQAIVNDADLSRLLNLSPFGRNIGANTARTNVRNRQVGPTTRHRVHERLVNSLHHEASRIGAGILRNALQSQFGPPTNELPVQFRPPTNELPGASPKYEYCDNASDCTTAARPHCVYSTSCARHVCQSQKDITRSLT